MKRFEIFRPGKHTAASGVTLSFSEADLQAAVAAYDPAVHEAPIVVGHPRDNAPAYGWIGALSFGDGGSMEADPIQVDADFAEMVSAGRFKKRSASWYVPGAANHPLAGKAGHDAYYLRHVGFLGAQPPAIKGLREVAFGDSEEGVVEFADSFPASITARLFRQVREWIISDKGVDAADKVVPDYLIGSLEEAARTESQPAPSVAYHEEEPMKIEELQAQVATLTRERDEARAAASKVANFAEADASLKTREAAIAAAEAKITRAAVEARVESIVKAGRLLPKHKQHTVDFAMSLLDSDAVINFGEGDKAKKVTQREAYLLQLEGAAKVVEFGEFSAHDELPNQATVADAERSLFNQVASGGTAK